MPRFRESSEHVAGLEREAKHLIEESRFRPPPPTHTYAPFLLASGENLVKITVFGATLSSATFAAGCPESAVQTLIALDFYLHDTQATPPATGLTPDYQFIARSAGGRTARWLGTEWEEIGGGWGKEG